MEALAAKILDRDKWPDFERADFLDELNAVADAAFDKGTVEGYLAALLIYHQLTEEMLRMVQRWAEFFVQLRVAPIEYFDPLPEKAMFGKVIESVNRTIQFENRDRLVEAAEKINTNRIALVHGLTKRKSLQAVAEEAKKIRLLFDEFYDHFSDTREWFMLTFKDLRKDGEWEAYVE